MPSRQSCPKVSSQLSHLQDHRYFIIGENLLKIKEFDPKSFEDLLPAEIKPVFQSIYMETTTNPTSNPINDFLEVQRQLPLSILFT